MNRNSENHFALNPTNIDLQRSRFDRSFGHKTTLNTGDLVPIFFDEVLPGDTFSMDMSAAIRMSTPIYPVMDNCNIDTYAYFIPTRLVWDKWKEFNGENTLTAWEQKIEYEIPQIKAPDGGWEKGTIADYFGIPTKIDNFEINALPFRAYVEVWNSWFRDQNLKDPAMVNKDETTVTGTNNGDYVANAQLGALPLKVAKYHDYFTSALPEPQKGPDVLLPLGNLAPVVTSKNYAIEPEKMKDAIGLKYASTTDPGIALNGARQMYIVGSNTTTYSNEGTVHLGSSYNSSDSGTYIPINLFADLSTAQAASVNALRQAFAVQRLYEKDARGGTRYREILRSHFGVVSPDARMQVPEYLGGSRHPINIDQVLQTSSTDMTSPQGNTAAYSLTNFVDNMFTKSFTEHGYIIILAAIRTVNTYQQGLERIWSKKSRFDFYWPSLANIGEQPIYNKEIYLQGTNADNEVFGYQEAWADYRYKPSRVSGAFRSNYEGTLDSWHYATYYESQPYLSSEWIDETRVNVDRTIAVQSELEDQFIADFYFKNICTRPMPLYSIPGLIDHH